MCTGAVGVGRRLRGCGEGAGMRMGTVRNGAIGIAPGNVGMLLQYPDKDVQVLGSLLC